MKLIFFSFLLGLFSLYSCENKPQTVSPPMLETKTVEDNSTHSASRSIDLSLLEIPQGGSEGTTISHLGYALSYNHQNLTPNWVAYELTAEEANGQVPRSNCYAEVPTHQDLKVSSMSIDELEDIIHLDLFHNLDDAVENEIEAQVVKRYWGI